MMRFFRVLKNTGFLKWLLPLIGIIGIIIIVLLLLIPSAPPFTEIQVTDELFDSNLEGEKLQITKMAGGKQKSVKIRKANSLYIAPIDKDFIDKGTWQLEIQGYQPVILTINENTPKKKTLQAQFKPTFGQLKVRAVKAHKPTEPIKGMFKVIVGDKEKTGNAKDGIIISNLDPGKHQLVTFGIQVYPKEEYATVIVGKTTDVTVHMEMEPGAIDETDIDTSWLELDLTKEEKKVAFKLSTIKLVVSPPHYDDIGMVLQTIGLKYQDYENPGSLESCDIFFLNCGSSKVPEPHFLKEYIINGGCLYTSDLLFSMINQAFPGVIHFTDTHGRKDNEVSEVVDPELQAAIGKKVEIKFDNAAFADIDSYDSSVNVILRSGKTGKPLMVSFKYGKGMVFYTAFHNHVQITEIEQSLLQTLVLKQISAVSGVPVKKMAPIIKKKQKAAKK